MDDAAKALRRGMFSGGVISVAIGVMLLAWPDKTILLVAALLGIFLLLLGILRLYEALSAKALPGAARALRGMAGLLLLILGIAVLRHLENSLTVLTMLLGIALMVGGLAEIAFGLTASKGDSRAASLLGMLEVISGLVIFLWPKTSLTVVWVVGVWLIAIGVIQLLLALTKFRSRLG